MARRPPRSGCTLNPYDRFRAQRLTSPAGPAPSGLLSLVTTVWNTDPAFVAELADCVLGQDAPGFEWLILDNGTTRQDTRARLAQIAADAPGVVRLERVEHNLGIIGGMRFCLERARNRYIVPLDSDDLITPDAVRLLASALERAGHPPLAYTDEDKLLDGQFCEPYCKPDWDPVLFFHSCYIAHLCAIDREAALRLGAYTDGAAEGSHDWDTFTRFHLAGAVPLHVPEIVYSWRMHPQSTSRDIASKNYVFASQRAVLERFVRSLPETSRYRIAFSPLFGVSPDWRILRADAEAGLMPTLRYAEHGTLAELLRAVEATAAPFLHLQATEATIEDPSWAEDALCLLNAFPDAALVGGRVHCAGVIVAADGYEGFGDGFDSPNVGRTLADPGYFGQAWKPHSADLVPVQHCVVRRVFLLRALRSLTAHGATLAGLAGWLGVLARRQQRRAIYSPFLSCAVPGPPTAPSPVEQEAIRLAFAAIPARQRLLSPTLGRTRQTAYCPLAPAEREAAPPAAALDYPLQHAAELLARQVAPSSIPTPCRFSLLTTLYAGSRAELFAETLASVRRQTHPQFEWIILEKGDVPAPLRALLDTLRSEPRVQRLRSADLSIIAGMRRCLEHASGDYVVPLDYDDTLTDDALSLLAGAVRTAGWPGLIYSDEDLRSGDELLPAYRRPPFDPVLNSVESYIWHLCAFRRDRALAVGVYSEPGAEFCHDWDTVTRFAEAGGTIHHLPEVLYHWRTHPASSSNSGTVNRASLDSVRFMLERTIQRQAQPSRYEIAPSAFDRGFTHETIGRRPLDPPDDVLLVCDPNVVPSPDAIWEAARLFEMHPDIGAVGGRILDATDHVIAACTPLRPVEPWIGRHRADGGAYASIFKPQTVTALPAGMFFHRRGLFPSTGSPTSTEAAAACRERGLRLAYSPLIEAHQATVSARPSDKP